MKNGITRVLALMAVALLGDRSNPKNAAIAAEHMHHRDRLLVNDYNCPSPTRVLNQRQKRKKTRQQPHGK